MEDNKPVQQTIIIKKEKSKWIAFLLWFFFGWAGAHRFYYGKTGSGVAQLLLSIITAASFAFIGWVLAVFLGLWLLVDLILIISGNLEEDDDTTTTVVSEAVTANYAPTNKPSQHAVNETIIFSKTLNTFIDEYPVYITEYYLFKAGEEFGLSLSVRARAEFDLKYTEWKINATDIAGRPVAACDDIVIKKESEYFPNQDIIIKIRDNRLAEVKDVSLLLALTVSKDGKIVTYSDVSRTEKVLPKISPVIPPKGTNKHNVDTSAFTEYYSHILGNSYPNYYYSESDTSAVCPFCETFMNKNASSCPYCKAGIDSIKLCSKEEIHKAFSSWETEQNRIADERKAEEDERKRIKKEREVAEQKKKNRKLLIILGIALVIFLLIYFLFIRPARLKAEALKVKNETFDRYYSSSYKEKVAMYPEMIKYGLEEPVVSFYDDDNNLIYSTTLMPGETVTFPEDFDHGDWNLVGWNVTSNTASDCSVDNNTMTIEDRSYTAVLGAEISYVDIDGSLLFTQTFLKSDSTVTLSSGFPSKIFNGVNSSSWKDEKNNHVYSVKETIKNPGGDLTLQAVYYFPVKVIDTDGTTIDSSTVNYGDTYTLPELDESVGYIGWNYSGEKDVIHTEKTIKIENRTNIILRSRYTVTYKNTLTNTEDTEEFTLDKGITISGSNLKNVNGYYGMGFEYDGTTYPIGSTLKPEGSITLTSVYRKSVSYGSSSDASTFFVDSETGEFYTSLNDVENTDSIIKGSISNDWFAITSNGNIYLSDTGKKNAEKIEYLYIPDTLNGRTVECLADNSFSSCTNLKAVRIPESVVRYGSNVFSSSPNLVIDKLDLTNTTYVGAAAFANTTIKELITTGTVPYSYSSSASNHPFYNVKGFETLTIKAGYSTIQNLMSSSMKKTVKSVNIPVSVTKFNDSVFEDCTNLKIELSISNRVTSIGSSAFKNSGITFTSVDLTGCSSYPAVGANAFSGTTVKKLIVNDNGVKANTNYGVSNTLYPFYGVKGFETLEYKDGTKTAYNVLTESMRKTLKTIKLPESITTFNDSVFENCNKIVLEKELAITSTVTKIGSSAFKNSSLVFSSVDLTGCSSYPAVGANAFSGTTVKKLIVDKNGVLANSNYGVSNTQYPFYNVNGFETLEYQKDITSLPNVLSDSMRESIKSVIFPEIITSFSASVFENCKNLKFDFIISSTVKSIGDSAFKNSGITFTSVDLTGCSSYPAVGANAFTGTTVKKLIVNDNGVKANTNYGVSNVAYPFYGVTGFETLEYKAGTTTAKNVLSDSMRKAITSVNIPSSVTAYALEFLAETTNLKIEFAISPTIKSIGDSAFKNSGITFTSVDLTGCSSYPAVGANAFTGTTVKKLIVNDNGVKANTNYGVSNVAYPFYDIKGFESLEYKDGTKTAYNVLTESMRKTLKTIKLPESITTFNDSVFENCNKIVLEKELAITSTVTKIGSSAFKNSSLVFSSVDLTGCSSYPAVGANAFTGTTVRKLIVDKNGVLANSSYGVSNTQYPFYDVNGFETLEYQKNTTVILNVLSDSMRKSIKSVVFPEIITSFNASVFENCKNLKFDFIISSTVKSIGDSAFKNSGITFTSVDLTGCSSYPAVGANAFTGTTVKKLIVNDNGVKANTNYGVSNVAYPFYDIKGFESLEYKDGTKTAYDVLSESMRKTLKTIKLPESITTFNDSVFENCNKIVLEKELAITSTVTKIGSSAFKNSSLVFSSVDLTGCSSYPAVGANAFSGTTVKKLIVNDSGVKANTSYGVSNTQYPFYDIKGFESLEYKDGTKTAYNVLSESMRKTIISVTIPASVTKINDSVFADCILLEKISLPYGTLYETNTFKNCKAEIIRY